MQPLFPSLTAALLYGLAGLYQANRLHARQAPNKRLLLGLGMLALLAHLISLPGHLVSAEGLNLDFFNAGSLIAACIIMMGVLCCVTQPLENLLVLLFPIGLVTVLLAQFIPEGQGLVIPESQGLLLHILLSVMAYGLLSIAMLQSLLLLIQDRQLKLKHPSGIIRNFPPLQTMEQLLFAMLWCGWLLLTAALVSGWMFVDDLFAQHVAHKTFLSLLAWLVFAALLWGRHYLGWRGNKAIRLTLAGFVLLMLAYFGSKLVREFILHI
ncbi:cytochrome C assembly family protein [Atopomonas sediminilitoris]|uniref:cytochrome C assembly family protein n=1 Tax=Atopomonas sediminilitoris TaxID=2919919 RepID=UPI001F4E9AF2|nr:cytochrome c biogenesis protein CcsA [Atopomonas sediminilitoris]MCJ8169769.1 cytochrome c biogenesis protein CcsA [Atopomonas sediminilitoris]